MGNDGALLAKHGGRWLANATINHHSPRRRKENGGEWRRESLRALGKARRPHGHGRVRPVAGRRRERCVACGPCLADGSMDARTYVRTGRSTIASSVVQARLGYG